MEHSVLHGTQLLGSLLALAAPLLLLGVLDPALRSLQSTGVPGAKPLADALARRIATWAAVGALGAALATAGGIVVGVAEIDGRTIVGGVDPTLLPRFATETVVGRLALVRAALLLVSAGVAARIAHAREPRGARTAWLLLAAASAGAVVVLSLVSHAAARPSDRGFAIALQLAHLAAAGSWLGSLTHLFAARDLLQAARARPEIALVAEAVRRFSPFALGSATILLCAGALATWTTLGAPDHLLTSAYGLTLLVKLVLVATLLAPAWINWRIVRPALERVAAGGASGHESVLARFVRMVELETTAGLLALAVAGILGSIAPPSPDGLGRLAPHEIATILRPRMPQVAIVDPATWVDSATRTAEDLRYSEFMHNWSGVVVVLLGTAWLLQSAGGRLGRAAGRLWPLALVPFAVFVGVMSDPEVWPLGSVGPIAGLANPVVLEHRAGALMIVALVWLGLREERRGGDDRPLGHALPVLMIVGSLLLLGHAHSGFGSTESLTTLINTQHAVQGGLGLLAGVTRWFQLRGLVPGRVARVLWPALVIGVGVEMAFSYRELLA